MFVDFKAESMKKKELFVVDPGLHTQNCRDVTKMHSKREKNE
jgi:hypothetical protein